jgi:carbon-monoxide dehydrogenase medium subunit
MLEHIEAIHRPESVDEALVLLRENTGRAGILAGGTDITVRKAPDLSVLVDISGLELNYIVEDMGRICIGAATPIQDILDSGILKDVGSGLLTEATACCASRQIRNMATVGGNLAVASPCSDLGPPLLALDADVRIAGEEERLLPLSELFVDRKTTALKGDEIIIEVIFSRPPRQSGGAFIKFGRTRYDLALVSAAVLLDLSEETIRRAGVAMGSVAPTPMKLTEVETHLVGKTPSDEVVEEAARMVTGAVRPITDIRASAEYRRELAGVIFRRAFRLALDRASKS